MTFLTHEQLSVRVAAAVDVVGLTSTILDAVGERDARALPAALTYSPYLY